MLYKKLILIPLLSILLISCSNSTSTIPNEINDKDYWTDSKELVQILENNIKDLSPLTEKQSQLFSRYEQEYFNKNESNDTEKDLFIDIIELHHAFENYLIMDNPESSESKNKYLNQYLDLLNKIEKQYNIKTK